MNPGEVEGLSPSIWGRLGPKELNGSYQYHHVSAHFFDHHIRLAYCVNYLRIWRVVTGLAYLKHYPEASEASNTSPYTYTRLVLGVFTYFAGLLPQLGLACV